MREKGPDVKVVGNLPAKEQQEQTEHMSEMLRGSLREKHLIGISEKWLREMKSVEYEKTPEQLRILEGINEATNKLRELAGVEPYNIPERNYHIIPQDLYYKIEEDVGQEFGCSEAMTIPDRQIVMFLANYARRHPIIFANEAFHETMHLKVPLVFEKEKTKQGAESENSYKTKLYRFGFEVHSTLAKDKKRGKHRHFAGLDEAFVALNERYFTRQMIKEMESEDEELRWFKTQQGQKLRNEIATEKGLAPDDIFWFSRDGEEYMYLSYPFQREVLEYVIAEIQAEMPGQYPNENEVFLEFNKSYFTGRLLPLARLMKKVFSKSGFEILGMMTLEKESAVLTLEALKRLRVRQKINAKK